MNQYLLSVCLVDGQPVPSEEDMKNTYGSVDEFNAEVKAAGAWVFAGGLLPHTSATVVRVKDNDVLTTDGPFAEGKEYVGGFWVIKAKDLDAALAWASKATRACAAPVEVRPFEDDAG